MKLRDVSAQVPARAVAFALFLMLLSTPCLQGQAIVSGLAAGKRGQPNEYVYQLKVSPAAVPKVAFQHRFTIEPHRTVPGNAVTHYLRSFGEGLLRSPLEKAREKFGDDFDTWYGSEVPIDQLPLEKMEEASQLFDHYVDGFIRRATMCREVDWGASEEDLKGLEAIEYMLPSVQQTRSIARVLALRARLRIAKGDYEGAIEHIQMTYRLAQTVGKFKFLVCSLVGIAEVGMANANVLDLIGANESPNLYWALRELPVPIVSIREALRLEMSLGQRLIPSLADVENAKHTDDEWAAMYRSAVQDMFKLTDLVSAGSGGESENLQQLKQLAAVGAGMVAYPAAKERLVQYGIDAASVESMSVGQVLMLDASRDYRYFSDAIESNFYLPATHSARTREVEREMEKAARELRLGSVLAGLILPAVVQIKTADLRIRREVAVLTTIESLRHHLATNGEFPSSLEELKYPAPENPFTNRPLDYKLVDEVAVIVLPRSDGYPLSYRYEVSKR